MLSVSIRHQFPNFTLNAEFEAPSGVTALFGRSGSGKTTIVNAIAGLFQPDYGRITVNDRTLLDSGNRLCLPAHRRSIGYVFQDARLFPHLTVRQNLLYGSFMSGQFAIPRPDAGSYDRIVDILGIRHLLARRPAALSGGERQRVALGRAILRHPRLLLMDEPLAALDEARKAEILPYLERLRDESDLPILYVTHAPAEIARLANSAVLLDAGRVVASGSAQRILSDPATAPILGLRETGAIMSARVEAHESDGLSRLLISGGPLFLPRVAVPPGTTIRLRIIAQDVMIALNHPKDISALNVLPVVIQDLSRTDDGVLLRLQCVDDTILARVTHRSAELLRLRPGLRVHAVLKAVSIAQRTITLDTGRNAGREQSDTAGP